VDVVGNIVDAVAQVVLVDQDVQRHLPDSPLPAKIFGKAR